MATLEKPWPLGQYRLLQKAYIGRRPGAMHELLPEDSVIFHDGKPGPHMVAVDDAAKEAVARVEREGGFGPLDPTANLELTMQPPVADKILRESLEGAAAENAALRARLAALEAAQVPAPVVPVPPPPPPAPPVPPPPPAPV